MQTEACNFSFKAGSLMDENEVFTMKLLVNTATNKVLFAEAPKEVVDFLFGLLEMPLGSVVKVLTSQHMIGSFGNLFRSAATIDAAYLQSTRVRANLLDPVVLSPASHRRLLLPPAATLSGSDTARKYYTCSNYLDSCGSYISHVSGVTCPSCNHLMIREPKLVDDSGTVPGKLSGEQTDGYVKEAVTYIIMDDLTVTPMSTISCITILNKFNVKDVGVLEERVVELGSDEGVKLLRVSLQSKTVLSDVFLAPDVEAAK